MNLHPAIRLLSLLVLGLVTAQGQTTNNFTGASGGYWHVATNWSLGTVPTTNTSVLINSNSTVNITTSSFGGAVTLRGNDARINVLLNVPLTASQIELTGGPGNNVPIYMDAGTLNLNGGAGSITTSGGVTSYLHINGDATVNLASANLTYLWLKSGGGAPAQLSITNGQTFSAVITYLAGIPATGQSTLNLNGGTLHAGTMIFNVTAGAYTNAFNLNSGGLLTADTIRRDYDGTSLAFNWNDGTIQNRTNASLTISRGANATTNMILSLAGTGTHTFNADSGRTITVASTATLADKAGEKGTLRKTGAGQLIFQGTNTYTGLTTVENGTLVVSRTNFTATITSNSIAVNFTSTPAAGTVPILSGPLSSNSLAAKTVTVSGGGSLTNVAFFNNRNLALTIGSPGVSGKLTANPSTVYVQPGQVGSTLISCTTTGCSTAQVYVTTEANPAGQLFAEASSFSNALANWISQGRFIFSLYANQSRTVLLDEIVVTGAPSPLRLPGVLGHNMVLQRNAAVPFWGWTEPGQAVQVNFADQTKTTTAGTNGQWQVRLDPMIASTNGRALQVTSGGSSLTLTNVLVGEVWVLSGQSNMEWNLTANGETNAIARANYPWLRTFTIGWPFGTQTQPNLDAYRTSPASDVTAPGTQWSVISPANAGHIYTVGFYFAESLRQALGAGVPIGLIQAAVGSTSGECWVGKATRDANPALQYIGTEVWPTSPTNPWFVDKYVMYHALIAPLQPYGMRGVLWYQGEGNTYQGEPNGGPNVSRYRDLLTGLIEGWRRDWNQGNFPFFLVQLPKYGATKVSWDSWERVREAQLQVSQSVPNTGLAISIDTGSADPHPLDKQPIGERLARLARAKVHGEAIVPTGPIYAGGTADTNGVNLVFANAGTGLQSTGGAPRTFEVAGADGVFYPATATITATDTVRLTSASVPHIVSARYGWDWSPDVNLFNSDNLPASPFRAEMSGDLSASPSKITLSPGTAGSSTLTWITSLSPGAHMTRSVGSGPEEAIGASGSMGGFTVSGIGLGKTLFRLYGDAARTRLLDSVEVVGTVAPLTVQSDGSLRLNNRPFTGIGVNYYSAFERVLDNPADTSYEAGFETLGRLGVPFARLDITGYWPVKLNLFFTDRAEYFRRLDGVVASAERHGVGLVPSLFWTTFGMADLAGERLDQLAVSNSVTRQKMREFATEVVNRYKNSPAIWAWEFSNEWNLAFDLPNYHEYLPTYPSLGNPATRDPARDGITTDIVLPAMVEIATLIKELDPGRPISTGHAMSQPFQWHLDQWKRGLLPVGSVYTPDSPAQAEAIALRHCPDPFDLLSIHVYGTEPARVPDFAGFASRAGKALFVGEFGTPPDLEANYASMLATVRAYAPLAAVWAFDRTGDEYNITATNTRSWMLRSNLPAGFPEWSRGWGRNDRTGPGGETAFHEYVFGAPRPGAGPVRARGGLVGNWLSLETTVRTNDLTARVFGEHTTNLVSTNWTTNGLSVSPSTDQSGVLPGCERRIFSVPADAASKFLRIRATAP